jgi:hypothetical protein
MATSENAVFKVHTTRVLRKQTQNEKGGEGTRAEEGEVGHVMTLTINNLTSEMIRNKKAYTRIKGKKSGCKDMGKQNEI